MLENFKNECKNDAYNNRLGKVVYDDIKEITHNDNLASLELTEDCYVNGNIIGTTNTKSIKINTIGKPNIFNGELENGSIDKDGQNGTSSELDTTTFIELKEKLNSINDTLDELDIVTGKGIRRIGECVLTGDENWLKQDTWSNLGSNTNAFYLSWTKTHNAIDTTLNNISTHFTSTINIANEDIVEFEIGSSSLIFRVNKNIDTVDDFKQLLKDQYSAGTPVKIQYVLKNPEEFTTEPVNIQLRKGYNKIEINDKNGLLNKTKLSYLADTEKTVEDTNQIIIEDAEPVNARSLIVYGNSFQETRSGKNLLNMPEKTHSYSGSQITMKQSEIVITGNTTGNSSFSYSSDKQNINLESGSNYTYSVYQDDNNKWDSGSFVFKLRLYFVDGTYEDIVLAQITRPGSKTISKSFTPNQDVVAIQFIGNTYAIQGLNTPATFKMQVELGDISTDYESYGAMPSPEFPSEIKCVEGISNSFNTKIITEKELKGGTYEIINDNNYIIDLTNSTAPGWSWLTFKAENLKKNTDYIFKFDLQKENEDKADIWTIIQTLPNSENGHIVQSYDADNNGLNFNSGNYETLYIKTSVNANATNNIYYFNNIKLCENNLEDIPFGKFLKLVDTGKNLFNKNQQTTTSAWIKKEITETGLKLIVSTDYVASRGTYITYKMFNLTDYIGKTVRMKTDFEYSADIHPRVQIGLSDENGENRRELTHSTVSGETMSFVVPTNLNNQNHLYVWFYFNSGEASYINGDTVEFKNIMLTIDNEDMTYESYIPNKVRNTEKFAIEKSTYTIDLTGATDIYLFFYDENDNLISKSGYHKLPYTFNNTNASYVRFMFKDVNNDNLDVNDITDIQINDKFSLYGKDVDVNVGVKYDDDSEEYIELGKYTIDKPNDEETVNLGEYKGYDYLDKLNDNYVCTIEDFTSATVSDVLQDLCNQCGLEIDNLEFENNDFPVNGNIFENYKCKDVLSDILELACSIGIISKDSNKLVFRKLSKESSVTLTKNDYSLLTKNQIYGPVNSFSIKESQIEGENVTIQDDESIKNNGETEFSIVDNIFLYTPELRQLVLDSIWNNVKGLTYYDCKIESYHGLPYLNAGDKITVEDDNGNYFDTYVLKHTFTYDGTFKSVIESPALTKQQTNIKSDVSLREKLNQTVINVYKDKKIIDALITENTEQGSKITQLELNTDDITARMEQNETSIQNTNDNLEHNYYQRTQVEEMVLNSASGVTNTFSEAGGNNILRNTDFSAKEVLEEGQEYEYWYGSAERLINSESANGYSIKIKKSNFYQEQNVANGNYTLSFYYKITNSLANVKVQINGQEYVLNSTYFTLFQTGIKNEDGTYKIEPINISDNHLKVEFITDIDDSIEIYDIMCNAGSVKLAYSQNANETRTDTVNIGKGITITSSTSDTKFVATPEIMGFKSVNGDKMITEFTNKGMTTKEAVVEDEAEIVGIIRQKVGNQIWDAVTGV